MIIAISPFSDSEASGHSLQDDLFYFEHLLNLKEPFRFYVPPLSAKRLEARFPNTSDHIVVVEPYQPSGWGHLRFARQLKIEAGAKVIFFGYLERLVLVWYLMNLSRPFSLRLVATNNISAGRVDAYRAQLKFFFHVIRGKLKRLVLHTEHEVRLLARLNKDLREFAYVKKHHLMIPIPWMRTEPVGEKITISFFGPPKHDKPVEPFLHLIASDNTGRFHYNIYNQSEADILAKMCLAGLPDHVSVIEGWHSYEAHLQNCAASDIIFMSHTRSFEGKLSGNLCDCMALGVPYICTNMEPMLSLHKKYGELGYLSEFDQPRWAERLLGFISWEDLLVKRRVLQDIAGDYSLNRVQADLDAALCL